MVLVLKSFSTTHLTLIFATHTTLTMSALHTSIAPRHPRWADTIAAQACATDGYVRMSDFPEKIFPVLAPLANGVEVINGRLCVSLAEFSRLISLLP